MDEWLYFKQHLSIRWKQSGIKIGQCITLNILLEYQLKLCIATLTILPNSSQNIKGQRFSTCWGWIATHQQHQDISERWSGTGVREGHVPCIILSILPQHLRPEYQVIPWQMPKVLGCSKARKTAFLHGRPGEYISSHVPWQGCMRQWQSK